MKNKILEAMSSFITGEKFDATSINDNNLNEYLKLAFDQKITIIAIYSLLQSENSLSAQALSQIKMKKYGAFSNQLTRTETFLKIYQKMLNKNLCPICVKGMALNMLYPSLDIRESSDEDLLVKSDEFNTCREILIESGFEFSSEGRGGYVHTFVHKNGCMIDLHRTLFPTDEKIYQMYNSEFEDIFDNFEKIKYKNQFIFCLQSDKLMLYLIIHAFKHFMYSGVGIRQICDISLLAKSKNIDWNYIFNACKKYNLTDFLSAILVTSEKYFGLNIDDIDNAFFERNIDTSDFIEDVLNGGIYGSTNEDNIRSNNLLFTDYVKNITGEKKSKLKTIFPSKENMQAKYEYANKHPALMPVAYANRIFDYISSDNNPKETISNAKKRTDLFKKYGIL